MTERELYKPLTQGAKKDGWHLTRIADQPGFVKRPFDMFGFSAQTKPLGLEVKMVVELSPYEQFPWKIFGLHQIKFLEFYSKRGCYGLIGVYEGKTRKMNVFIPSPDQYGKPITCANVRRVVLSHVKQEGGKHIYTGWNSIEER